MTALMTAINSKNLATVNALIQQGVDVNERAANGDVPVIMAAYKGYTDILKALLAGGADVTAVDAGMKATALHAAAYAGRTEAVKLLIAAGIAIDQQGPYNGYTALHDAVWQNHVETVRALIEGGADTSIRSLAGETALQFAQSKHYQAIVALLQGH